MANISRLYKDYDTGARVVAELERSGIPDSDISIIANNDTPDQKLTLPPSP